ncbi:gluconokinase [Anaerosporomusa subterranea]|uniref:Gluconokinase n=1 Tax=Anaerosporomusa subterranea TaxID=1794912 RepID=A0A154BR24_ANASB|nr:gluconokinase [Anaerosporomusa subterranea]KYZ76280.1 gluconokinase [Anaerosporomusa subterranea]
MQRTAVIGVDIGTTGCRAVIYLPNGQSLANFSAEYRLFTPHAGWAEQQPADIWQAFITVVRSAVQQSGLPPQAIAGMCFSVAFHSFLAVDAAGEPLCPVLTWADSRSQPYTEKLKTTIDGKALYHRTGCPLHPMYPLSKAVWLRQERPEAFRRAAKFISIKEYVIKRLTGQFAVDRSIASGTGLYNFETLAWDQEALAVVGITADHLSTVYPTSHVLEGILPSVAGELGLDSSIAVVLGAGDGAMANLGSGVVRPGQLTATVGTSGAVRMLIKQPQTDPQRRTWCYNLNEEYWMAGAAINNGGISLRWVRDQVAADVKQQAAACGRDPYDLLTEAAANVAPGAEGLLLLPLFSGERAPYWNADARAVLFGVGLNHETRHIVRAALEGVMFRMYSIFSALKDVAGQASEIRVSGSFTRSPLWLTIMADIFGREILAPGEPEGAAFGASAFGMVALGLLKDLEAIGQLTSIREIYRPDLTNHATYRELYDIYLRVYWNLQKEFHDIAAIQRRPKS